MELVDIPGLFQTYSTLLAFIVAMALHPKEQERAQAELDEVIGRGGLPSFEDRASLPYVDAILRETMRWFLSLPAGKSMGLHWRPIVSC